MRRIHNRTPGALRELWEYRELFSALVERNLKIRYQRSILGAVWALLNPILTGMILVGVFSVILRVETPHYWAFLISGYFPWIFTLHTLGTSITLVSGHSNMTRSLTFPPDVLLASQVASRFVEFAVEMFLVVVVLASSFHHGLTIGLIALPLVMLLHTLLTAGVAYPIAALGVFFEDVQHVVPVALTMLTLVSPVYYPMSAIPDSWQPILSLNPFAGILRLYHLVLYEGRLPGVSDLVTPAVMAVAVFVLGTAAFRWKRAYFAEIV
jgi:ABC-type polysaccharide/polyol phosphate export permease